MRFLFDIFRKKRPTRLDGALEQADLAIERFRLAAEATTPPHSRLFWDLAAASVELRAQVVADPSSINAMRRFLFFYLPKMGELCLRWAQLAHENPLRVPNDTALGDFRSYLKMIRTAKDACLSRRYDDLHLTMDAFDDKLQRLSI